MRYPKKNINKESGVALILTVIIISAVILIASMIANIVITQLQLAEDIGSSVSAIYAADSGVECQLYNTRRGGSLNCNTSDIAGGQITMQNGALVKTTITGVSPNFVIISLGSYRMVKRQFEVTINTGF
ncbi:MAG: hypothetical protein Q7J30_01395 [Candidatus Azambacteria bacterium]|nr:hypothetical protein [Candidatus Azambacteria bacterium]